MAKSEDEEEVPTLILLKPGCEEFNIWTPPTWSRESSPRSPCRGISARVGPGFPSLLEKQSQICVARSQWEETTAEQSAEGVEDLSRSTADGSSEAASIFSSRHRGGKRPSSHALHAAFLDQFRVVVSFPSWGARHTLAMSRTLPPVKEELVEMDCPRSLPVKRHNENQTTQIPESKRIRTEEALATEAESQAPRAEVPVNISKPSKSSKPKTSKGGLFGVILDVTRLAAFSITGYVLAGGPLGATIGFSTACAKSLM
eukprot:s1080_g6.t1